jgi:hypothetical protein
VRIAVVLGVATALVVGALVVGSCGGDEGPSAERFCGEIDVNRERLTAPSLTYEDDIAPLLALYRDIGALAPLAIEKEWDQVVLNYETASTVVPGDAESVQRAVTMAYQSEKSAATVSEWLMVNCAVDIGPLTTLVPHP